MGPLHVLVDSTGVKVFGAGKWLEVKHGVKSWSRCRKLQLAMEANSGLIVTHALKDLDAGEASQVRAAAGSDQQPHRAVHGRRCL